jgi:hypothetical protein
MLNICYAFSPRLLYTFHIRKWITCMCRTATEKEKGLLAAAAGGFIFTNSSQAQMGLFREF